MIFFRPLLGPTLFFIPAVAMMIGLGAWQIERLGEKNALLASIAAGMSAPAVPLREAISGGAPVEWRHVEVRGRFDHSKEAYLFSIGREGVMGAHVLTPLIQENGEAVLVDRGFVPDARRDPDTRAEGRTDGDIVVKGYLRLTQKPGLFTPNADLSKKLFFYRDVPGIAAALAVTLPPLLIEADGAANPGGFPLGGQTSVDIPNDHLQYAITWFGLALTLTVIYLLYHRSVGRLSLGGK